MKIRNISCDQFAGIRNKNISFEDGINLVYGKNESGKSTIVNLLSRTLFQDAHIDKRSNKDFIENYYPGAKKDSSFKGDSADGKVVFETEKGEYSLTKIWGAGEACSLSTPDGMIRRQSEIDSILEEALLYGEGVYSDMLFSSQRNTDLSLQTLLDSKTSSTKQEITDVVSKAFSESGGVSLDKIEEKINKNIAEIEGKHWDAERSAPQRSRTGDRFSKELGEILKAYYALEDAKEVLKNIDELDREFQAADNDYNEKAIAAAVSEEEYNAFNAIKSKLDLLEARRVNSKNLKIKWDMLQGVLTSWPDLSEKCKKAAALKEEKESREILDKFAKAEKIHTEKSEKEKEISGRTCPEESEISAAKQASRNIETLSNKLCGMNLNAAIKAFGDNEVKVISLRTGSEIDVSGGVAAISEAVKITVPGVLEIELSPANVNVAEIEIKIAESRENLNNILGKYSVKSVDELETLAREIGDIKRIIDKLDGDLKHALDGEDYPELSANAEAITAAVRSKDEISEEIYDLCEGRDVDTYVGICKNTIEQYEKDYTSIASLQALVESTGNDLAESEKLVKEAENIPEQYKYVDDAEEYLAGLFKEKEDINKAKEEAKDKKLKLEGKLESYRDEHSDNPKEDVENAERIFKETETSLKHWLHIKEVFTELKEEIHENPMEDIARSFTEYLGKISDERISSEFPNGEKLDMNIYSGNNLLDYGKLSEGTKETVSLAFRLAVLDHLFPNGGGVIVLDDPFTDMDAERESQGCELIKECAKKHQVIFLTCDEKYGEMLGCKAKTV